MTVEGRNPSLQQAFVDTNEDIIIEENEVEAAPKQPGIDYSNDQVFEQEYPGQDDPISAPFQVIDPLGVRVTRVSDKILFGTQYVVVPAGQLRSDTRLLVPHHAARLRVTIQSLSAVQGGMPVVSHVPFIGSIADGFAVTDFPITFETRDAIYVAAFLDSTAQNDTVFSVQYAVELIAQ